jgi:hypothetical protein
MIVDRQHTSGPSTEPRHQSESELRYGWRSAGVEPHLQLMPRYFNALRDSFSFIFLAHPPWWDDHCPESQSLCFFFITVYIFTKIYKGPYNVAQCKRCYVFGLRQPSLGTADHALGTLERQLDIWKIIGLTATTFKPRTAKVGTNVADRRRSLCRYSSRAD